MPEPYLAEAQDDATLLAIRAQEAAGLDIVTDGEIRRESYSNRFATALDGVDLDNPGTALDRSGHPEPGAAHRRADPAQARRSRCDDLRVPAGAHGPADQDHRARARSRCRSRRRTTTTRARRAGAWTTPTPSTRRSATSSPPAPTSCRSTSRTCRRGRRRRAQYGLKALNRALDGISGTTAVHICFGYAAIIHERPSGYSFLPELAELPVQAGVDRDRAVRSSTARCSRRSPARQSWSAASTCPTMDVETPDTVVAAHPARAAVRRARAA